jgi:hypothetical protein
MDVWTIQIAKHRLLRGTDIEFVDITLKSGILDFAPTPALLYDHKRGAISNDHYRAEYRPLCWRRIQTRPDPWTKLIHKERVALACYCPKDCFCHRLEILKPLEWLCRERGIRFEYHGEIVI